MDGEHGSILVDHKVFLYILLLKKKIFLEKVTVRLFENCANFIGALR